MTPDDPQCPECGAPVGATASFCRRCEADLDGTGTIETAVVDLGGGPRADDGPGADAGSGASAGVERGKGHASTTTGAGTPERSADGDGGWFRPDGLLDDVSTAAVGIVGGLVVGLLAMVLVLFATGSPWGFLVGPVCWVGVGLHVGWTRSVFDAVRKACYLVAPALVALPLLWFGEAPQGGSFGGRLVAFAISEAVVVPVALLLVGAGYWVGGKAPDD